MRSIKIFVATIHFNSSDWIELQNYFLKKFLRFQTERYTLMIGIESSYYRKSEDQIYTDDQGSHAKNLNFLASEIINKSTNDEDLILFIDGDAFPIKDISELVKRVISENKPAAIQRIENNGDLQPHPSFALFTIGQWKKLKGDWSEGFQWKDKNGKMITDVGAEMLRLFEENRIQWIRLGRTNKKNIHPLLFGIYGDLVYHHGAAFRPNDGGRISKKMNLYNTINERWDSKVLDRITPARFRKRMRNSMMHPIGRLSRKLIKKHTKLAKEIYCELQRDRNYVYTLLKENE